VFSTARSPSGNLNGTSSNERQPTRITGSSRTRTPLGTSGGTEQRELSGTGQGKGDINSPTEARRDSTIVGGKLYGYIYCFFLRRICYKTDGMLY
jgi:hypothetical protein